MAPTARSRPPARGSATDARVQLCRPAAHRPGRHGVPPDQLSRSHRAPGPRARVPGGRPRRADAADRVGHARHRAPAAARAPAPAALDPGRPGGQPERQVRRRRPAAQRLHRGRRGAAHVPGHRDRDRDGQARPAGADRRPRRRAHRPRRLRRLHHAQPALLPAGPADHVGGAQHRQQPAGPGRAVRDRRVGVQVPVHGQGRRVGEQVLPLPGDQGGAEPGAHARLPGGEAALPGHLRVPAVSPGHRDRRDQRRVRPEDRQVRLGQVPRHPARGRARRPGTASATASWSSRCSS